MQKVTPVLKIKPVLISILLAAGICFSQTDSSPEDSIAAKFCFYADTSGLSGQIDSVWKLSVYEQVIPLMVTIQAECEDYGAYFSAELISEVAIQYPSLYFFGGEGRNCYGRPGVHYKCTMEVKKEYYIYDYIGFYYNYKDSTKISELFGKEHPLKWKLDFSMGKQKQTLSGTHYVYVSDFCNETQMAQIKEIREKKNERKQALEKEEKIREKAK